MKMKCSEEHPLKWPTGWERTRIPDRKAQGGWKRNLRDSREALDKELERMKAVEALVTYNTAPNDRLDPGVSVYFSLRLKVDYSWQQALGLDTPVPTIAEIDDAFRKKALQHHPDRGGDMETFQRLTKHRDSAKAWVMGTQHAEHEYVIPCDRFDEVRLNLNAVRLAIAAMRQLDRVGVPGMLERSFRGMRAQLPAGGAVAL